MSSRTVFALLVLYLALELFDTSKSPTTTPVEVALSELEAQTLQLRNQSYQQTKHRFEDASNSGEKTFFMNTTALFKGKYSPVVQTENISAESGLRRGSFDWSTPGAISFHLFDDHSFNEKASFVDGIVRIKVPGQGIEYKVAASGRRVLNARRSRVLAVSVAGVHILDNGRLYLTGIAHGNTSATANLDKILSIIPSPHEYTMAKGLVVSFYEKALERLRFISEEMEDADDIVPAFVSDVKCRFNMVLQMRSIKKYSQFELQEYEQELIDTRGLPESNVQPGPIMTNISIHSPDCQLLLTSTAIGTKIEIYRRKMINYAALVWLSSGVELYALFTQMAYSSTPSKRSKVSQTTIVIMICYDAYLAMLHFILGGVLGGDAFLAFAGASFIKFLGFAVFGIRYLLDLCKSRGPGNSADSGIGIFYSRFCTYLIGGIFFFYQFGSSSPFIATVTGVVMSSLWVPQIFVNIHRNTIDALHPNYIILNSGARLILPIYFLACPKNILTTTLLLDSPNYWLAASLISWIFFQTAVLFIQDRIGARAFIPDLLYPARYDYHPILEFGPPSVFPGRRESAATSPDSSPMKRFGRRRDSYVRVESRECSICFSDLFVEDGRESSKSSKKGRPSGFNGNALAVERKRYMVTPCLHVFHSDCLLRWMEMKMECPVCRKELPPP